MEKLQNTLSDKDKKITDLETQVTTLKEDIVKYQVKFDDVEAENRSTAVIISGNKLPLESANEDPIQIACDTINGALNKQLVAPANIMTGYRIGKKSSDRAADERGILVKFCRRDDKHKIFTACKSVQPQNLYINESLIPARAYVLYLLRKAKRVHSDKISACGSYNGRVYLYPKTSSHSAKNIKFYINTVEELDAWGERVCGVKLSGVASDPPDH